MSNRVEKITRRYTIVVAKDGDGVVRRKKVRNRDDKVLRREVVADDS